jgi:SAM-dependent methyltransferase
MDHIYIFKKRFNQQTYKIRKEGLVTFFLGALLQIFPIKLSSYPIYFDCLNSKYGLEIGGPSKIFRKRNILPIYPIASKIDICNIIKTDKSVGLVCDATDLSSLPAGKYDFVASSHVLEHISNPLKALSEWLRVMSDSGSLLLVVPHKDGCLDHSRPLTPLSHLIDDLNKGVKEDDPSHIPEILQMTDPLMNPPHLNYGSFKNEVMDFANKRSSHHHVFDHGLIIEIYTYFNLQILSLDLIFPYHIIAIGKKLPPGQRADNERFLARKFRLR